MLIISRILVVVVIQSAQAARDKAVVIDGFVALYSKKHCRVRINFLMFHVKQIVFVLKLIIRFYRMDCL